MPSMSIASRGGFGITTWREASRPSDSMVTRRVVGRRPQAHGDDGGAARDLRGAQQQHQAAAAQQETSAGGSCGAAPAHANSAQGRARLDAHLPAAVGQQVDVQVQVGRRQQAGGLLGPLGELQARAVEDVAKARVLPLARVVEAVEVEMPGRERRRLVGSTTA
jgi:hypothetical protein